MFPVPNGAARGEAHAATVRQIAERNGAAVVFERKPIADISLKDLERVKDAERNRKMIDSLRAWIDAGKPKDKPPLSPKAIRLRRYDSLRTRRRTCLFAKAQPNAERWSV